MNIDLEYFMIFNFFHEKNECLVKGIQKEKLYIIF